MLTVEGCRKRAARLRDRMEGAWDAILIHLPEHLLYFGNFYPLPNSLNYGSSSYILIERDGPVTLFTDNWLAPAKDAAVDEVVVTEWYAGRAPARNRAQVVAAAVRERIEKLRIESLAAEVAHLPVQAAPSGSHLADIEPAIRTLREIKDPDEIEAIQAGIRTAEAVHAASRELLRPGLTEIEYYARLLERATVAAGRPFVMMCDLASGPRAAEGGGAPTSRRIEAGDLVILDMFPYVEGYRGDITNTLVAGGNPTAADQALFETVIEGLRAGERLLRPGTPVSQVYNAVDDAFRAAPGGRTLVHHAGHAIGLGHPEAPEIVPDSGRKLEAGMVMTLEPGLYGAPAGGIRVEHDYLITPGGFERLSNHRLGLT